MRFTNERRNQEYHILDHKQGSVLASRYGSREAPVAIVYDPRLADHLTDLLNARDEMGIDQMYKRGNE